MNAEYRCLDRTCGHEWTGHPGPKQCPICKRPWECGRGPDCIGTPTQCPACGNIYVKWMNYEAVRPAIAPVCDK